MLNEKDANTLLAMMAEAAMHYAQNERTHWSQMVYTEREHMRFECKTEIDQLRTAIFSLQAGYVMIGKLLS